MMFKRVLSVFIILTMFISSYMFVIPNKVLAYQNSSYYSNVRIGLKSLASKSLTITLNGGYTLSGQTLATGNTYTIGINGANLLYLGTSYSSLLFIPVDINSTMKISNGIKTANYHGNISFKILSGLIFPINSLDIETYLKGVVGNEMSNYFPLEALKAQAVAARNYTLSNLKAFDVDGYDLTDGPDCQAYCGAQDGLVNIIAAVDQTKGEVQLYNDSLVQAFYAASDGGYTEASENVWFTALPYLIEKQDTFDNEAWPAGNYTFTSSQIETLLKQKAYLKTTDVFLRIDMTTIAKYNSGRISVLDIIYKDAVGVQSKITLTKMKTKTFLDLPSSLYSIAFDSINNIYTFVGKGNGHAVGLSQIGALNRAKAGQDYKSILNFYYNGSLTQKLSASLGAVALNTSNILVSQGININASGISGSGVGYLYKYVVSNSSGMVYSSEFSTLSSLNYIPTTPDIYNVSIYIKDKLSTSAFDDQKALTFTAYSKPTISSLSLNSSSLLLGQTLNSTIIASNGSPNGIMYKFIISANGILQYTQDYSRNNSISYIPSMAGNYIVTAYIRDNVSQGNYDAQSTQSFAVYNTPTISSFNLSKSEILVGQTVTSTGNATVGSPSGSLYKFVVTSNGVSVFTQDFSTSNSLNYVPTAAGNYTVYYYVKDNISQAPYDAKGTQSFIVYNTPTISNFTLTKSVMLVGQPIIGTGIATNGSPSGNLYKFVVTSNGASIFTQEFSTSNSLNYVPSIADIYTVDCYVKDSISQVIYDVKATQSFTAYSIPVISTTKVSGTMYIKRPVTISVSSVGGSTTPTSFKYELYNNNLLINSQDYSLSGSYTYTPVTPGSYSLKVYAKDKLSTASYDSTKTVSMTILKEPVVVSKVPIYWGMKGTDVVNLQTGTLDQVILNALNNVLISKLTGIK